MFIDHSSVCLVKDLFVLLFEYFLCLPSHEPARTWEKFNGATLLNFALILDKALILGVIIRHFFLLRLLSFDWSGRNEKVPEMLDDVLNASIPRKHFLVMAATLVGCSIQDHVTHHDLYLEFYLLFVRKFEKINVFSQEVDISAVL